MPGPDPRKARLMQTPKVGRPMTREEQKEANKNKKLNNKVKKIKSEFAALKETARDKLNPMKADRVFDKYRSPRNAKIFFANEPGSKYEGMADKAMERKIEVTKKNQNLMAKGGRAMLRGGGICKKGMNKKAVGKNS
jgi:hypothetical protein|tara:strand:- start:29 stop:439 length:411 start_codon:yes stop_codon:yes gene_type:complete